MTFHEILLHCYRICRYGATQLMIDDKDDIITPDTIDTLKHISGFDVTTDSDKSTVTVSWQHATRDEALSMKLMSEYMMSIRKIMNSADSSEAY